MVDNAAPIPYHPNPGNGVARAVIAAALGQVGYHEGRSGGHWNNAEKYAAQVPGLAWADFQPWCAVFVSWAAKQGGAFDLFPITASTNTAMGAWRAEHRWSEFPAVGAQVLMGTSPNHSTHTGLVVGYTADEILTVEGNTNTTGSPEGDGVYLRTRRRADPFVLGYGYPKYPEGIASADPAWRDQAPGRRHHQTSSTSSTGSPGVPAHREARLRRLRAALARARARVASLRSQIAARSGPRRSS